MGLTRTYEYDERHQLRKLEILGNGLIKINGGNYYLSNAHGDVTALVNGSGTVSKRYEYDAFGNEVNKNVNDTNPFRYKGEYIFNIPLNMGKMRVF